MTDRMILAGPVVRSWKPARRLTTVDLFATVTGLSEQSIDRTAVAPKARIKDVAQAAGVSVSTVSLVLNEVPGARITEATRQRVQEAAARLSYTPSTLARGLRLQRTGTIGLVSDEIASTPHAGRIIAGAHDAAARLGLTLLLVDTGVDRVDEAREIASLLRREVDGVLYAAMYHRELEVPEALHDVSTVLIDASTAAEGYSWVVPDEEAGGHSAAMELLGVGHRRIGFLNSADDIPASRGRLAGFRRAHDELGVPVEPALVVTAASGTVAGYDASLRLLSSQAPTALFCFNDRMAMGAYRAASELGLRVPEDVSIVGFDDQRLISEGVHPQLTTVALPHFEMGARGVRLLVDQVADPTVARQHELLPCPLVRRGSVAPPRAR